MRNIKYAVNGVYYSDVEEAFNKYIEVLTYDINSYICSYDAQGITRESITVSNAKFLYRKNGIENNTPLKKQLIGYILKHSPVVKQAYNAILEYFKENNMRVDKYKLENIMLFYYSINNEPFNKDRLRINKQDNMIEIHINGDLIGFMQCT